MTFKQEVEALITTFLYKYYKDYVEPLEIKCDELEEENNALRRSITRLRNKQKGYSKPYLQQECERLRKQNVELNEKNKQLRELLRKK
ncbi:MAG: hypothetical protein ACLUVC_02290 [Longibaculum sp.]